MNETGTPGRTCTCITPFRRRMPHLFDHGSMVKDSGTKWSRTPVLPWASPRSKRGGFVGSLARDDDDLRSGQ